MKRINPEVVTMYARSLRAAAAMLQESVDASRDGGNPFAISELRGTALAAVRLVNDDAQRLAEIAAQVEEAERKAAMV